MTKELVFVTRRDYVSRLHKLARENPHYRFVAANKSIHTLITAAGLDPINPDRAQSEAEQEEALKTVLATTDMICDWLKERSTPPGVISMTRQFLMVEINSYVRLASIGGKYKGRISVLAKAGPVPIADYFGADLPVRALPAGSKQPAETPLPFLPLVHSFNAPFVMELRALKRLKGQDTSMPRFVRLEARRDRSFAKALLRNVPQSIRAMLERGKASRALLIISQPVIDGAIESKIAELSMPIQNYGLPPAAVAKLAAGALAEFEVNKGAVDRFLNRYQRTLRLIVCDSSGKPFDNALALAARERGIPMAMASHGGMVVHGPEPRRTAAEVIAGGSFNWNPDIPTLIPHSPLQTLGSPPGKRIIKVNSIKVGAAGEADTSARPFRILYAPNFVRWNKAMHGLTVTCYETYDIAKALALAAAKQRHWQLDIRIKVTIADKPKESEMERERGILPRDIEPLIDIAPNIRNSSADSYAQNLCDADLVITEGMTAVMFEALDYRTPVLLFNRAAARTPSMPSWRLGDLARSEKRNAVYATSLEEDFAELLALVAQRHKGVPLSDDELRDYCWVDEPPNQPHYLHELLS